MKLAWKLAIPQICIAICLALIGFAVINAAFINVRDQYIRDVIDDHFERITKEIHISERDALRETSVFVRLPAVIRAYEIALSGNIDDPNSPQSQEARELLRRELAPMLDSYSEVTGRKMRLHFHLPNGLSLARLWREKQTKAEGKWVDISDDLRSFRQTVMDVNRTGKIAEGMEGGSGGFAIRGVIPIKGPDGRQLGSAEVLQDFRAVADAIEEKGRTNIALYVSKELLDFAVELQDVAKHPLKGDFVRVIGAKDGSVGDLITPELLAKGKNDHVVEIHGAITLATLPITDYQGKQIGVLVSAINTGHMFHLANMVQTTLALALSGIIVGATIALLLGSHMLVIGPLNRVKANIHDVFAERAGLGEQFPVHSNDEIGELLKWFNALTGKLATVLGELRDADVLAHSVLDALPISANYVDADTNILYCNQEAVRLFGLASKQEYKDRFFELSPTYQPNGVESRAAILAWNDRVLVEGRCQFEWMHQKPDGEPIPCLCTLVPIKYRDGHIFAVFTFDLRERQATMARLEAEAAHVHILAHWYESILNAIPLPVFVQDMEQRRTFINQAAEGLLEKRAEDVIGLPCHTTTGFTICGTDACTINCAKRGQKQTHSLFHKGRSWQVDVAVLKGLQDQTIGFVEIMQDVTEVERLARQRAEAEAANQAKSAFLATMSHEIRTPMNAILGLTEIQLRNATLSPGAREAFERIYTSGCVLLSIINNILDLSRIESGKMELILAKYEVARLISETVQLNAAYIGGKAIEFSLRVDENIPAELYGDELRIKQILNNLLSNAFKYTKAGKVILAFSAEDESEGEDAEITLVCRVSDTGEGLTAEQIRRLYDKFVRFSLETNRFIEGTGLGMAITRQLIHLMKGKISVESEPGQGSVFTVRLPQGRIGADTIGRELAGNLRMFKVNALPQKIQPIRREPMPYGSVLVVDDSETNLFVTAGLLAPYGLSVDTAESGLEAIDKIRGGKVYDLIFMDHMMPGLDGVETVKILREMGYSRPIVVLTANVMAGQAEVFLKKGFDGFLAKPTDTRQLDLLLHKLIRESQPPEVIEAAHRWQRSGAKVSRAASTFHPQLANLFVRDAEKAIAALMEIHGHQYRRDNDMRTFVTTTHAMKSALANIGETELAATARALEQAGREADMAVISARTPDFIEALRQMAAQIAALEEPGAGAVDEDPAYLREKLRVIETACAAYDRKAAKDALKELRQKAWSRPTTEGLDAIAGHLLHSDFEEAAAVAKQL